MSAEEARPQTEGQQEKAHYDPLDPKQQNVSDGLKALEKAYNAPEVSFSMLAMGAGIVIGIIVLLVALVVVSGGL